MKWKDVDHVLVILLATMLFFTLCMFASEVWFGSDGQFFQVISNLLTGVTGAFLARIKPQNQTATAETTTTQGATSQSQTIKSTTE